MSEQNNEEVLREQRRQRMKEMQRQKEQQMHRRQMMKRLFPVLAGVFAIAVLVVAGITLVSQRNDRIRSKALDAQGKEYASIEENGQIGIKETVDNGSPENVSEMTERKDVSAHDDAHSDSEIREDSMSEAAKLPVTAVPSSREEAPVYAAEATCSTQNLGEEIVSSYAVLIDLESDEIVAQKSPKQVISPASMTKVLTVLVAAEHVTDLDDTFTMTIDITDYSFINDCSNAGFLDGEVVTVRDLFYGTVLPSGGDAAVGLATYVAGSQEEFVKLMNKKLEELGLSKTAHVTNCVGLYDEEHYCTVYDMAMILEAAIENELCREVLSAHTYTTSVTEQHSEGILLSNWFLRRIEDKDTGGVVMCGKTGYVVESGNCAASYGIDKSGREFICVTADATSSWRCIYDHVALYKQFATEEKQEM